MRTAARTAALLSTLLVGAARGQDGPAADWLMPGRPGLTVGSAVLYVRPAVPGDAAYVRAGPAGDRPHEFDWGFERAHAFWAGYAFPNGYGLRFRGFVYDADAARAKVSLFQPGPDAVLAAYPADAFRSPSPLLAATGLGPDSLKFQSGLRLVSTEFEATYAWAGDLWTVEVSGGVRHQTWRQWYWADLYNLGNGQLGEKQVLRTAREYAGVGPVAAVFARRELDGPWAAYGSLRGAVIAGDLDESAAFLRTTRGLPGPGQDGRASVGTDFRTLPLTEADLGLEYRTTLGWLGLILRGGVTVQSYYGVGGPTGGTGAVHLWGGHFGVGVAF